MISLLMVDDEEELLDLARHFLKGGGIELFTSVTASGALERHRARPCDAIVCDLEMPEMDGIELLNRLRDGGDTTPFIILTGKGSEQDAMKALNLGADFYLTKGGDPEILFSELARIVGFAVKTRQIEKALRESEQRYRTIFEITATGVLGSDGTILLANTEAGPLLGYRPEELVGKVNWRRFIPPDELPRISELWRRHHEDPSAASLRFETRLVDRWGGNRYVNIAAKLVPGTRDSVISITDITGLKKADEKLRISESLYRTIFGTTGTGTFILDETGTIVLANAETESLLGFPPRELEGRIHWSAFIPPDELPRLSEFFRLLHEDPASSTQHYEARLVDRWGVTKYGIFSASLIPGSRNSVLSVIDISGRRKAEEALRESEEKYRTLIEGATDAIVVIQDGRVVFCNSRATEMWGGNPGDLIGQTFADCIAPEDIGRIQELHGKRMGGETVPRAYDAVLLRKDGSRFNAGINAGAVTYQGKPAALAFVRDVTERKHAEEDLLTAHRKLNLLSSITRHDILNQLMVILGYTEILRQEVGPGPATGIITAVEDAARNIRHSVDFTKEYREVGIQAPTWQDLREVIARAGGRFSLGGVKLQIDIDGVLLYADPLLERAIYNLIDNALRHGDTLTRIRFSARESASGLSVSCEDDGVGIPAKERERVFSPRFASSSGYGLFLVREILGITGITIREVGEPGRGADFRMEVPRGAYRIVKKGSGFPPGI
ncbi:MAG TPA: PAS domain S-box protein [Methanomicrobiales archaeon]|nr:PAS domain S-box protein [Methanomicrobiales archaeon]